MLQGFRTQAQRLKRPSATTLVLCVPPMVTILCHRDSLTGRDDELVGTPVQCQGPTRTAR